MAKWLEIKDAASNKTVSINTKYIVSVSHGGPGTKTSITLITGVSYLVETDHNVIMNTLVPLSFSGEKKNG